MKTKTLLTLLLSCIIATTAFAQKGLSLEIIAEPGSSMGGDFQVPADITSPNSAFVNMQKSFTFGFSGGVTLGYYFEDNMGLSLGLLYSGQGQKYDDFIWYIPGASLTWQRKVTLNYLKIPFLYNYIASPDKAISFRLSAGFYVAFLVGYTDENILSASNGEHLAMTADGQTLTQSYSDPNNSSNNYTDVGTFLSKPFNSSDVGATIAAGLQFKLSDKISIPVMINYQTGFSDIKNRSSSYQFSGSGGSGLYWDDGSSSGQNETLTFHNSNLGLFLGLKISLQ
jgi:hypothetical protein